MGVSKRLAVWLVKPVRQLLTPAQLDPRLAWTPPNQIMHSVCGHPTGSDIRRITHCQGVLNDESGRDLPMCTHPVEAEGPFDS